MSDVLALDILNTTTNFLPFIFNFSNSSKVDNTMSSITVSDFQLPERKRILFGEIVNSKWAVILPITVTLENADGLFIASDDVFRIYGDGDSEFKALEDYKISLIDYYQLIQSRFKDDNKTEELFNHLKQYILMLK